MWVEDDIKDEPLTAVIALQTYGVAIALISPAVCDGDRPAGSRSQAEF